MGASTATSILDRPYLVFRAREVVAVDATVDAVFEQRLRIVEQRLHCFSARGLHVFSGILVIGNGSGEEIDAHDARFWGHARVDELERAIGCTLACCIAIEEVDDLGFRVVRENSDMLARERSAQRCHRIGEARLVKRDHIGVAFDDKGHTRGSHRGLRLVKAVEHFGLVEERRFTGVEVFWLTRCR